MNEPILFPDAVALAVTFLAGLLGEHVGQDVPPDHTIDDTCVTVLRTGGPRRNLVTDDAQLTIETWAPTSTEAHDLAQLTRAHMLSLAGEVIDGVAVYRVGELAGPQNLPDPESDQPRYTFSVSVAVRGAVLTGS